jgi:hypothetical protein
MNEQTNRRAMIRRMRAKSSLSYPEVVHRFCGYLRACAAREIFSRLRLRARAVKRQTDELSPAAKFFSSTRGKSGLALQAL